MTTGPALIAGMGITSRLAFALLPLGLLQASSNADEKLVPLPRPDSTVAVDSWKISTWCCRLLGDGLGFPEEDDDETNLFTVKHDMTALRSFQKGD